MAKFVEIGKHGAMVNVEQIAYIEPAENKNEYIIHMIDGSAYCVTYDEFLEITGQRQRQSSDKKYAIKVLKTKSMSRDSRYLNVNYRRNFVAFEDKEDFGEWRASFTEREIEELKKRDDIAIDWDKVELEEVENAE